jgi:hypothetical protein
MAFGEFLFGSSPKVEQVPRFSPQQLSGQNQLLQQALQGLGQQQNKFDFAPIEQQARTQFKQKTIPGITEMFESMGGIGSSGFQNQLGQAGAGLEQSLAALKSQYGLQQQGMEQNKLLSLLGLGMQPQFESLYNQGSQGFIPSLFSAGATGLGAILPLLFSGKLGPLLALLGGGKD